MALTKVTVRPNSATQGSWGIIGAVSGGVALSDNTDTTYVQLTSGLARLPVQVMSISFPAASIPTGAWVYSVGVRRRIQTVVQGFDIPQCLHWFRCRTGTIAVAGQQAHESRTSFASFCPTSPITSAWTEESVFISTIGPDGQPWSTQTNLGSTSFFYDMGRGDESTTSILRVSEVYLDITYQQLSTVTVTAPTGTFQDTKPTITWTYASLDSQPQVSYRVAIYTQSQTVAVGFVPFTTLAIDGTGDWVLGVDAQWTMTTDLTNGSYVAYVQAQSQWSGPGDFPSSIGSTSWTRSVTVGGGGGSGGVPPAVAVLNSAVYEADTNRVALTVTAGATSPPTSVVTVYASRNGQLSWDQIPSLTYVPIGAGSITVYDEVAPLNITSYYRVVAYGGSPLQAAPDPSNVRSATPQTDRFWLKSPSNPLLNTVLPIAAPKQSDSGIKITKRRMMGTFQLLGGAGKQVLPFVVNGPTYGDEYEIELIFIDGDPDYSMDLWSPVDRLDNSGETLLLQKPDGDQLWVATGPGSSGTDTEEMFNVLAGDPRSVFWRRRKLVLTQVDPPTYF